MAIAAVAGGGAMVGVRTSYQLFGPNVGAPVLRPVVEPGHEPGQLHVLCDDPTFKLPWSLQTVEPKITKRYRNNDVRITCEEDK